MGSTLAQLSLLEQARVENPGNGDDLLVQQIAASKIAELAERPPVNLRVVAASRGIEDIRVEDQDVAGSLTPEPHGLVMRLRSSDSRVRRRFTGFHEVSHTFQPGYRDQRQLRCEVTGVPRRVRVGKEALSDIGAVELLMPSEFVQEDLARADFGIATGEALGETYEASVQASCYRMSSLWPEPTLVVVLEEELRKAERDDPDAVPRLRVLHAHPGRGCWPYVPRNKSARDEGALVRAFASEGEIVEEWTNLDDLVKGGPERIEVSAKGFNYRSTGGEKRRRVIAVFRQPR